MFVLECSLDFFDCVGFDDVADLDVVVALDVQSAVHTDNHFLDVVLEALEAVELVVCNDDTVADNADKGGAGNLAVEDVAARNSADGRDLVGLSDLGAAEFDLADLGGKHALESVGDLVYRIVNDAVEADIDIVALGAFLGGLLGTDVEADDNSVGGVCQHDVGLADGADCAVDNSDLDFLVGELFEGLADSLDGAVDVRLDDDGQLLHLALGDLGEEVVEGDLLIGLELLFLLLEASLVDELAGKALILNAVEDIARCGDLGKTCYLDGNRGSCDIDALALVALHGTDTAQSGARDNDIACVQGAVLNEDGCDGAAALVESGLDDGALCKAVGVGGELLSVCYEQDHLEEVFNAVAALCGDRAADGLAAPLLTDETVFGQLLLDAVGVCVRLIHLVDGDDDLNACSLGVVDSLNGLRHDAVVCCDDDDSDIGDLSTAGAHRGERSVSGGVEEGDGSAVDGDLISTDVLGDAACFACGDVGLTDSVEQGGLAVVDVAHDDDDRAAGLEVLVSVLGLVEESVLDSHDNFVLDLCTDLHCDESGGIVVDDLRSGGKDAHSHQALDDLGSLNLEAQCELAYGQLIGELDLELLSALLLELQAAQLFHLLLSAGAEGLALLLAAGKLLLCGALSLLADVCGAEVLVALVVLVDIDLSGAHIDMAGLAALDLVGNRLLRLALSLCVILLGLLGTVLLRGLLLIIIALGLVIIALLISALVLLGGADLLFLSGLCCLCRCCGLCRSKILADIGYLTAGCIVIKDKVQFLVGKSGHVLSLVIGEIFAQEVEKLLARDVEVLCDLVYTVFIHHIINLPPHSARLSAKGSVGQGPGR